MTRRSDLMLEDLFGCTHEPETPIADEVGAILYWRCRCGAARHRPREESQTEKERDPVDGSPKDGSIDE